jgi:arginine exporter protein ArgO
MAAPRPTFPIAEGIGIFVGVVAWDLLADGHLEIIRAVLIAGICSLAWFGLRCWKTRNKHPER